MAQKEHYLPGRARNINFRNMQAFQRYTAFLHIHNIPHHRANSVTIAGHRHTIHCQKCKEAGINKFR